MFEVQIATDADVGDVLALESRLFAEDAGVHDPHGDVGWPARDGAADFADLQANPDAVVWLARADGEAVGLLMAYAVTAGATRAPIRFAVLRSMYVAASHRRSRVASALIDEFLGWARRSDCAEAHVNHYVANGPAGALYERFGFEPNSLNRVLSLEP